MTTAPDPPIPYVERLYHKDNLVLVPPVEMKDSHFYIFPIRSDPLRQQILCERILNQPSDGLRDYRVFFPYLLLVFAHYGKVRSKNNPKAGFASYKAGGFLIPVRSRQSDGATPLFFFPYCAFADYEASVAGARELQGWSTQAAKIELPRNPQEAGHESYSISPLVFERFGPDTKASRMRLVEVKPTLGTALAAGSRVLDDLVSDFTPPRVVSFALLKQFPDAAHPERACHQSGVEVKGELDRDHLKFEPLPGSYALTIRYADSDPLVRDLGLDPTQFKNIEGFHAHCNFTLEEGAEVWRAP